MIIINNREYEWIEGQTFGELTSFLKNTDKYDKILEGNYLLMINGKVISHNERLNIVIADQDDIRLLPSATGG